MPYKNPKDRKKQTNPPVGSKAHKARMERQRARREMDKTSRDANKNGKADKREGKDVSHKKPLSRGGSNKDGVKVESRSRNRSRNYKKPTRRTRQARGVSSLLPFQHVPVRVQPKGGTFQVKAVTPAFGARSRPSDRQAGFQEIVWS